MAEGWRGQTIKVPLNQSQALAIDPRFRSFQKNAVIKMLQGEYKGRVTIHYDRTQPALVLKSLGYELEEAYLTVVERLQELRDFCILDMNIETSTMGRFIGKKGTRINEMKDDFEVGILADGKNKNTRNNVTIFGKKCAVEEACIHIQKNFNAKEIGYRTLQVRRNHAPDDNDEHIGNPMPDGGSDQECALYKYQVEAPILNFVKYSEVHMEKLQGLFPSDSFVMKENEGTVAVVGKANDIDQWEHNTEVHLAKFFSGFMYHQIHVHKNAKVERSNIDTSDLIVKWDDSAVTATVWGLKESVIEILSCFESIQNRKRSVSATYPYEKSLYPFVKQKLEIQDLTAEGATFITLMEDHVEFQSQILEIDSYEEWKNKCDITMKSLLDGLAHRKLEVPTIHGGQMVTKCCRSEGYVVEWIQEDSALLIYGLEQHVLDETKLLQGILYDLKNKKKNVSMKYPSGSTEIVTFIKDSAEHFENLVKDLGHLGLPVLDSNIVTVNAVILETESIAEWEKKCKDKLEKYFFQYDVAWVEVEEDIRMQCVSLEDHGRDVITRWDESKSAFCIVGIKQLIDASEQRLTDKIRELQEYVCLSDNMDGVVGPDVESSVTISVKDEVMKYLHLIESQKSMQGVSTVKTSGGVKITGKARKLRIAKAYINSVCVKVLRIKRFGVYRFMKEDSTRWKIEALEIKNDCSIHVERLPDPEYQDERFVCLPKVSNITIKVEEGDITEEVVDVIVNTTNNMFSFDGPLSTSVFQKAGDHLRSAVEIIDNQIRYCSGGSLNCKMIFHVAIPNTAESMEDLILKVLRKADERNMKSIAMPTIGAGHGGWKSQDVSAAMQKAFNMFATESNNLKLIKVILFHEMSNLDKQLFLQNVKLDHQEKDVMPPVPAPVPSPVTQKNRVVSFFKRLLKLEKSIPVKEASVDHADPVMSTSETHQSQYARILIFATNQCNLTKVSDEIQNYTNHFVQDFIFNESAILRISQSSLELLKKMANEHDVRIIINKKRDVHSIIVQGIYDNASKVKDKVQEILQRESSSSDLPIDWIPMSDKRVVSVPLDQHSAEYQDIEKLFLEGNRKQSLTLRVKKICRVQNPALYRLYQSKRHEISNRADPPTTIVRRLFHGTDRNTINLICYDGFNRSYAGKNATVYGKGTYFATESSRSDYYAGNEVTSKRHMFVADVLTGDYCKGHSTMIDAPRNPATKELYDSVVDQCGFSDPTIYVVFKDWSAYPSYVVTYSASLDTI